MYHNKQAQIPPGGLPSGLYMLSFQFHDMRLKKLKYQLGRSKNVQKTGKQVLKLKCLKGPKHSEFENCFRIQKIVNHGKSKKSILICMSIHFHLQSHLPGVTLPFALIQLSFGDDFNQSLEDMIWPNLHTLILGAEYNLPLRNVQLPKTLERLTFGNLFNQSLAPCQKKKKRSLN